MIPLRIDEIARACEGVLDGPGSVQIRDVVVDSRAVAGHGVLFGALAGQHTDGHDHVDDAVARGAAAVLVARPVETSVDSIVVDDVLAALAGLARRVRSDVDPDVVAVTGSVGKTTVKDLIAAAVATSCNVVASSGSYNNELGVPLTLLSIEQATEMLVVEIGARHRGDIAPLARLAAPDVAVVTEVAAVHLEPFGSIDAIASTKAELVDALGPDGIAVLNTDSPRVAAMASRAKNVVSVSSSGAPHADVRAEGVELVDGRAHIDAATPWGQVRVRMPLVGRHQVVNGLLALAAAAATGVAVDDAAAGIDGAEVSRWRGQVLHTSSRTVIDDAYNANPLAMRSALRTLVDVAGPRPTTAILGEMAEIGATSQDEHHAIGLACAASGVSRLVAVGAAGEHLARGARDGGMTEVATVADASDAAEWVQRHPLDDEVVLVKASRVVGLDATVDQLVGRHADQKIEHDAREVSRP